MRNAGENYKMDEVLYLNNQHHYITSPADKQMPISLSPPNPNQLTVENYSFSVKGLIDV